MFNKLIRSAPTGILSILILTATAFSQEVQYTADFPIHKYHFSPHGGNDYFPLDPGHRVTLEGEEEGEYIVLIMTILDQTKKITLTHHGKTREIITRVLEEQESIDGELYEISRNFYARCLETGDVFYFGEEVDFYENGEIVSHEGAWLAGVDGAKPGIIMPGTFMLGARYYQEVAPDVATDRGENTDMGVLHTTQLGTYEDCVTVTETNPLDPESDPADKIYAPGIGLINDEGILQLTAIERTVTADSLFQKNFVPFSNNPYFPLVPGHQLILTGEEDGEIIEVIITILDELKEITLNTGTEQKKIYTRILEEQESANGELTEISRNYYAQCLETGDVYYFGEEVDIYEDGLIVSHDGAWEAGIDDALPGIMMPGRFIVGAGYYQEVAPNVAMDYGRNVATGLTIVTPSGTYEDCVQVAETTPLEPGSDPSIKVYTPWIGLINDDFLELQSYTSIASYDQIPMLSLQEAILLSWSFTDLAVSLEASSDLENWNHLSAAPITRNGLNEVVIPIDGLEERFFRLSAPSDE